MLSEKRGNPVKGQPTEEIYGAESGHQPAKKQFVEPVLSTPVDVLEATTFFQVFTGVTQQPTNLT